MKIKYEQILTKNPSDEFKLWWLETFCKKDVYYTDFINANPPFKYKQWFQDQYFCEELEEFEGIKKGDYVYFEHYGIGSIGKAKVSKIEKTSKEVVYFWIGKAECHYEWNRDKIFKSFEGLKDYWIRKIIHLKEE